MQKHSLIHRNSKWNIVIPSENDKELMAGVLSGSLTKSINLKSFYHLYVCFFTLLLTKNLVLIPISGEKLHLHYPGANYLNNFANIK
jgi:hypothetical protein